MSLSREEACQNVGSDMPAQIRMLVGRRMHANAASTSESRRLGTEDVSSALMLVEAKLRVENSLEKRTEQILTRIFFALLALVPNFSICCCCPRPVPRPIVDGN